MLSVNQAGVKYISTVDAQNKNKRYLCKCPNCGEEFVMFCSNYYSGNNACKCKWKYRKRDNHKLYEVWYNMKTRCYYSKSDHYKNYGERGITVCDEWLNSFETFCKWAKENGYADNLTIDRIDVNGNYEPNNCRWITIKQQSYNKRNTLFIGDVPLKKYCYEHGLNYAAIYARKKLHPNMSFEELIKFKKWEIIE